MSTLGKRAADEVARPNKRARQREQKRAAHQIAVQSDLNRDDTGPIKGGAASLRLPAQIQVERQLSTYAFETKSLLKAIRNSSAGSSIRAWQLLPRHKRRRNASHNLLALPKRLRSKGQAELRASKTTARSRADVRRRKGRGERKALGAYPRRKEDKRRAELIERATQAAASGKAWLETHLWHAKRFRMSARQGKVIAGLQVPAPDRWGFTLAEESNTKSFRSSWRDEKKAVTVLDRSYDSWFRVSATVRSASDPIEAAVALSNVLRQSGLEHGWQAEWQDGKRFCDTILSTTMQGVSFEDKTQADGTNEMQTSKRARAPVQVVWVGPSLPDAGAGRCSDVRRRQREVLLRTHPAGASQLERAIRQAIVPALRAANLHARLDFVRLNSVPHPLISAGSSALGRKHRSKTRVRRGRKTADSMADAFERALQREWVRQQAYNIFEIGGPSAAALLAKVLVPVHVARTVFYEKVQSSQAIDGEVVSLHVHDPRLSFPPRAPLARKEGEGSSSHADLGDGLLSHGAPPPKFSSGEIQSRRSRLPTPGARLLPTSKDDTIPVVVLRRIDSTDSSWTLLVPRGWGRVFWLSLVHPGTRILGQLHSHTLRFDKGKATFPHDWVGTPAYDRSQEKEAQRAFQAWQRTPPAKRCNFDSTGARWPFGGQGMWIDIVRNGSAICASLERNAPLCHPPWLYTFHVRATHQLDTLVHLYADWVRSGRLQPLPTTLAWLRCALLCVRVTACRRGSFERWDEVHHISSKESIDWRTALDNVQADKHERRSLQQLEHRTRFAADRRIGSVTTAYFSLSNGRATALAAVSLLAYLDVAARDVERRRLSMQELQQPVHASPVRNPIPTECLVLLRSVTGGPFRAASLQPALLN